jgi:hypothetical protein
MHLQNSFTRSLLHTNIYITVSLKSIVYQICMTCCVVYRNFRKGFLWITDINIIINGFTTYLGKFKFKLINIQNLSLRILYVNIYDLIWKYPKWRSYHVIVILIFHEIFKIYLNIIKQLFYVEKIKIIFTQNNVTRLCVFLIHTMKYYIVRL